MQKSYCYTPGVSVGVGVSVRMQNVRANVKVLEFKSFCIFSCILTLLIIPIKPLTSNAYDRRASGDWHLWLTFSPKSLDCFWKTLVKFKYSRSKFQVLLFLCPHLEIAGDTLLWPSVTCITDSVPTEYMYLHHAWALAIEIWCINILRKHSNLVPIKNFQQSYVSWA